MPNDRPTPIYDLDGERIAATIGQAAAVLRCSRPTVYACSEPWEDGRRLVRLPNPAGQRLQAGRPTLLPGEETPRASIADAARAAGVARQSLHRRSHLRTDGVRVVLPPTTSAVPVLLPDGSRYESLAAAARAHGCSHNALYAHIIDHRDGCAVLGSLPDPANVGRDGFPVVRRPRQKAHEK